METKQIQASKINWLAMALVILGALQAADFTEALSPELAGTVTATLGVILGVLRTWFTKKGIANGR